MNKSWFNFPHSKYTISRISVSLCKNKIIINFDFSLLKWFLNYKRRIYFVFYFVFIFPFHKILFCYVNAWKLTLIWIPVIVSKPGYVSKSRHELKSGNCFKIGVCSKIFINIWCNFFLLVLDLKIYTLEKDNFADFPFLTLCVRNGPSVSFGTNFPWDKLCLQKH